MKLRKCNSFQSPSGDSLFSDRLQSGQPLDAAAEFQSPSGDSLFSDKKRIPTYSKEETTNVSIP